MDAGALDATAAGITALGVAAAAESACESGVQGDTSYEDCEDFCDDKFK